MLVLSTNSHCCRKKHGSIHARIFRNVLKHVQVPYRRPDRVLSIFFLLTHTSSIPLLNFKVLIRAWIWTGSLRLAYGVLPDDLRFSHYLPCHPLYFLPFGPDCSLAVKTPYISEVTLIYSDIKITTISKKKNLVHTCVLSRMYGI